MQPGRFFDARAVSHQPLFVPLFVHCCAETIGPPPIISATPAACSSTRIIHEDAGENNWDADSHRFARIGRRFGAQQSARENDVGKSIPKVGLICVYPRACLDADSRRFARIGRRFGAQQSACETGRQEHPQSGPDLRLSACIRVPVIFSRFFMNNPCYQDAFLGPPRIYWHLPVRAVCRCHPGSGLPIGGGTVPGKHGRARPGAVSRPRTGERLKGDLSVANTHVRYLVIWIGERRSGFAAFHGERAAREAAERLRGLGLSSVICSRSDHAAAPAIGSL
jgi:hypothetical protein